MSSESYFCGAEILGEEPDSNEETNTSESSFYETASETEGIEDKGNEADSEDNSDEEHATRSPIPWECCNQIICACTRISPVEYVDYDSDDEEIAQENEEDILLSIVMKLFLYIHITLKRPIMDGDLNIMTIMKPGKMVN